MSNYYDLNKSARIVSRVTRNNQLRTETTGREDGPEMAVSTNPRSGRTRLFIDPDGVRGFGGTNEASVELTGRQARTLFRLLAKHYGYTGKSLAPVEATIVA